MEKIFIAKKEIKGIFRRNVYAKEGEKLRIISNKGNVYIVESLESGDKFPVNPRDVIEVIKSEKIR